MCRKRKQNDKWSGLFMVFSEIIVFLLYLAFMLGIGVYFFLHSAGKGDKE